MLEFVNQYEFSFGNPPIFQNDIPSKKTQDENYIKIANYNNKHHGIIDNEFLSWALKNNISLESIKWFVLYFSQQNDKELLYLIDALFTQYTIYCDESNNCVKFDFKDKAGSLNTDWRNDFVLAGIAYTGSTAPFDIDELFKKLRLQKTTHDVKLKHISKYDGEDCNRIIDILKSKKLSVILDEFINSDVYLHWSTQSLLYYALVDIVDSVLEVPILINESKNILYKYVQNDLEYFLSFLAKYDYPCIKEENVANFCSEFICWIENLEAESPEEDFCLELIRQGCKTSKRNQNLLFLNDNRSLELIDNFVPLYAMRLGNFPNSIIHFDKCGLVEDKIGSLEKIYCSEKIPAYDFLDSKANKWIQLADIVSGIIGALLAFVNSNTLIEIKKAIEGLEPTQKGNLKKLMFLIERSATKNKYFDHMSCNYHQWECISLIKEMCHKS